MAGIREVDVNELLRLWNSDMSNTELCLHFGLTGGSLWSIRKKYGLPIRQRVESPDRTRRPDDPTPEELEERAACCRARRASDQQDRDANAGRQAWTLPSYAFNGRDCSFSPMGH